MANLYTVRITSATMDISWAVNDSSDLELLERCMVKIWRIVTEKEKADEMNRTQPGMVSSDSGVTDTPVSAEAPTTAPDPTLVPSLPNREVTGA